MVGRWLLPVLSALSDQTFSPSHRKEKNFYSFYLPAWAPAQQVCGVEWFKNALFYFLLQITKFSRILALEAFKNICLMPCLFEYVFAFTGERKLIIHILCFAVIAEPVKNPSATHGFKTVGIWESGDDQNWVREWYDGASASVSVSANAYNLSHSSTHHIRYSRKDLLLIEISTFSKLRRAHYPGVI